ncbi:DUF6079 family protein [Candidatus Parabeggiatoa sp. HSG14]|uniref:DUF6079 family protein n=1 Tax=Candidatus Parabeggiatoa sp. HSG14 TaxID=3055593 RepID=UPI0025A8CB72|nr:DUF6079 family protein [Thiotrichales bacterium HSG14]
MQYADLIQFENLETVIQFQQADIEKLVKTYVISEEMAAKLTKLVFEQLRFNASGDNKGLFIVGNYGTGKSHLMAVISSIAENAKLIKYLNHQHVADTARQTIAGQFQIIRVEMSAVSRSLRDCLTEEIETHLNSISVNFHFPAADTITNNKGAFEEMMATFKTHYPEQGLLLVVDELLEFLSGRKDRELITDLSFLREIGEVCQNLHFRFIAGLQETVFDNPRFKFAANELRRVKDRFEQVLITRKDIKFVVAERLLKKSKAQKSKIRKYLMPFAQCYGTMNERMDEFVDLFPVHPDYIDIFERIIAVEQREVLKTLERAMQALLNQKVPDNYPGLLAYDSYWNTLRENFSFRATDDIREVINCSQVLENRIEQAFTRPNYKAMALQIIHALSVHRLTMHNFYTPMGVTAQELRDGLCLYQAGIEELGNPADDLLSQVELVLREILKTVNRQFISTNHNNGQYYLDLKKSEDFDAIIENRADIVEDDELDRYYYAALRQVMEVTDEPYVGNFLIWQHELEWLSHKVTRLGYLFFGTPNERATAVPQRAFYLYFLQPYDPPKYKKNATGSDEVFFRLKGKDDEFHQILRNYAAASILVLNSSGHPKSVYESKANVYLAQLVAWLQNNLTRAFEVTYQNRTKALLDWTKGKSVRDKGGLDKEERINFRELIELIASICLEDYFYEQAPEYPLFPILITGDNLLQAAQEALRGIASKKRTKQANSILDALKLLDGEHLDPLNAQSIYATHILGLLQKKPHGQVLNQAELLPNYYLMPETYRLESEFVIVIVAALVYTGELVLALPGQKFNTANFSALANTSIKELLAFKHLEPPKDFNVSALKALFKLFDLSAKLALKLTQNKEEAIHELRSQVNNHLETLVKAQSDLAGKAIFWGKSVLTHSEIQHYKKQLTQTKHFLETLQTYSTPNQFKNFRYSVEEVTTQQNGFEILQEITVLYTILRELNPATAYLMAAEAVLPPKHGWIQEMKKVRDSLLPKLTDKAQRTSNGFSYHIQQKLGTLQQTYRQIYLNAHQQAKLGENEHEEKQLLLYDIRLTQLKELARINVMPKQQLDDFEARLNQLETCVDLTEYDLIGQAFCPHCDFKPTSQSQPAIVDKLAELSETLEQLHSEWTQTLLTELKAVANTEQWGLLQDKNRVLLDNFLNDNMLPEVINREFIKAVQEALSGLIKVSFNLNELQNAIIEGGFPVTLVELQRRINHHLQDIIVDKNPQKIRIVLEA